LKGVDYDGLRHWQAEQRAHGKLVGIGFSSYVEVCGLGPSSAANAMGFIGGLYDSATVRVHPLGKVTVLTGVHSHGQGHETAFAQIVADELGVKVDDVDVVHGDTDKVQHGMGTYGSRSAPVGGGALKIAATKVREKALKIAAHLLEIAEEDVEFVDNAFRVKGSPDKSKTIADCAFAAYMGGNLPVGVGPMLEEQHYYDPENFVYPFGTHICIVEVDRETGETHLIRYFAVDDCGRIINPLLRDGQIHGGIAQGIAQALWEEAVYDENGQLLSGSLMDYAIPKASFLPHFELGHTETPSPHNPMGVKGIGEAGTIASTPAVVNAVMDALSPLGISHIDMPLRPAKVWAAIDHIAH
jgi:carbon-monoxide dehydrogenase large subunit